ncbi:PLP-dependent aminotransferase family protein [Marinobacterium rhizophilum]|uniref:MocR-like pyridoxine biosynthesis transcription factor PdxR n=1 Tax=Marinobacterium rhizophilum TaxID=420402 RepID=UPI000595251E|nr:PLP-dependent aminotransferase family protein [Marinobacterium rhizophilum]
MTKSPSELFLPFLKTGTGVAQYRNLFRAFQQAILTGDLASGAKLPASRALSQALGISRTTVKTAYEMLQAEGYIETRHGAGSFVSAQLPEPELRSEQTLAQQGDAGRPAGLSSMAGRLPPPGRLYDRAGPELLAPARPCLDSFPWSQWQRAVSRAGRRMKHESRASAMGVESLRREIARYLQVVRGVRCEAQQVMVCSGSQQALYLALQLLLDAGNPILVEQPGYPGIDGAIAAVGAHRIAVAADEEGFCLQNGLAQSPEARLALLTPSRNYPMGYTLSLQRRLELLNWATETGSWLIEDDYDSEFRFDGPPLTSLQGLGGEHCVLYAGTFSRILHPSIRLGYLVLPQALVEPFHNARRYIDGGLSLLPQLALAEFMSSGQFASHVRRMRKLYRRRRDFLNRRVEEMFGGRLKRIEADGGMHSVFLLPPGSCDQALCHALQSQGLGIRPLSHYYDGLEDRQGLVIGFAGYSQALIERGLEILYRQI